MQRAFILLSVHMTRDFPEFHACDFLFYSFSQVREFTRVTRQIAEIAGYRIYFHQFYLGEIE